MAALERLHYLLSMATSPNPDNLKEAEIGLSQLETQPRFHIALLSIVVDRSIDLSIRMQSILYLKNGIEKYWRKQAPNSIQDSEKEEIRRGLLQGFTEPSFPIALQIAVAISRIARFDVPASWPELIPAQMEAIRSDDPLVQHRGLLVAYRTVKTLSTKRLTSDRQVFLNMNSQLLPYLLQIWTAHHGQVVQAPANVSDDEFVAPLEKSVLSMKILRKAIIFGLKKPHDNQDAMRFISTVLDQVKILLTLRSTRFPNLRETLEKYIILHFKIIHDLLETHPYSFVPVMKEALQTCCMIAFSPEIEPLVFQRCVIHCLNMVKQVLTCTEYKLTKDQDSTRYSQAVEADVVRRAFFVPQTCIEICKALVTKYLPMTMEELEMWDADPEQYAGEIENSDWRYSFRPCVEASFVTIFHEYRELLAPVLVEMVKNSSGLVSSNDLTAILRKEALYTAAGLVSFDLYDEVDFDQWLVNGIAVELSVSDPNYRLIRRRAVWLLGRWSGVKLSPNIRPKLYPTYLMIDELHNLLKYKRPITFMISFTLYKLILPLLDPNEDLVVRLTAARSLKVIIDDFEFCAEEMKPYLNEAFGKLFGLLKEVNECDTKLNVLNVLSYLIERVGVEIRSICTEMIQYLPSLWNASIEHNMLRCSILSTLLYIVQGLGTISETLAPFLYEVISLSTNMRVSASVYLIEDGLELWMNVLHNTKHLLPCWMQLTEHMPPILELGSENLRTMIYIIQSYILLSPVEFITQCGAMVCEGLQGQYTDLKDEAILLILRLLDLIVKIGPPESIQIFKPLILNSFRAIHEGEQYPMLMSFHLSIASRILLGYQQEFNGFVNLLSNELRSTPDKVAGRIMDVWLDKMNCVTQSDQRKLLALALASLLTSGSQVLIDRIYLVLLNITETLNDILKPDDETKFWTDSLQLGADELINPEDLEYETEHEQRKRNWSSKDIVYNVNLRDYFQTQLAEMANQLGEARYSDIMQNVDVETRKNMQDYVQL